MLASASDGKVALIAAVNPAAQQRGLSANDLLRAAAPAVGGRGGGKADVAQGGGTEPDGIPAALANLKMIPVTCFPFGRKIVDSDHIPFGWEPMVKL